jgi:hypothetical protein
MERPADLSAIGKYVSHARTCVIGPQIERDDPANLRVTYLDEHKYAEAEKLQREALALNQKVLGPDHPNTGATWYNLG